MESREYYIGQMKGRYPGDVVYDSANASIKKIDEAERAKAAQEKESEQEAATSKSESDRAESKRLEDKGDQARIDDKAEEASKRAENRAHNRRTITISSISVAAAIAALVWNVWGTTSRIAQLEQKVLKLEFQVETMRTALAPSPPQKSAPPLPQ